MRNIPPGKMSQTAAFYYAFLVLGLIAGVFGPTLTTLASRTHSTLNEISIIFAARSFGYLVGSLLSGKVYDRGHGQLLIASSVGVTVLAFFSIPLIPLRWLLTLIVLALGLAEGGIDVGGNSFLSWMHGDQTGPFMNGLHFFFGAGAFLSPIVVAQVVLSTGEITWAYWFLALIALPSASWLAWLPSPAPHIHPTEHSSAVSDRRIVGAMVAFFFLYAGAEVSYGNWIFTYATKLNLTDATSAALLTSGFWGSFTLARLLAVPLSTRFKPGSILVVDMIGAIASVALVLFFRQSQLVLWVGTLGAGAFLASLFPTMLLLAGIKMKVTGQITSWLLIGAGGGAMLAPWLIGQLFEPLGAQITMAIVLVCLLGTLASVWVILGAKNPSRLE
jgi:MFS transporter, FHS family, Na+ dependent glucose transporter 1